MSLGFLMPFVAGGGVAVPNLSGTLGSPNNDTDVTLAPATATAGWSFLATGDLTRDSGSSYNGSEWFGKPGKSTHLTPSQTYYIRATKQSGTDPNGVSDSLGSWLSLASGKTWQLTVSSGQLTCVLKIEIATDSGGTDIVATGYYEIDAESTP